MEDRKDIVLRCYQIVENMRLKIDDEFAFLPDKEIVRIVKILEKTFSEL